MEPVFFLYYYEMMQKLFFHSAIGYLILSIQYLFAFFFPEFCIQSHLVDPARLSFYIFIWMIPLAIVDTSILYATSFSGEIQNIGIGILSLIILYLLYLSYKMNTVSIFMFLWPIYYPIIRSYFYDGRTIFAESIFISIAIRLFIPIATGAIVFISLMKIVGEVDPKVHDMGSIDRINLNFIEGRSLIWGAVNFLVVSLIYFRFALKNMVGSISK